MQKLTESPSRTFINCETGGVDPEDANGYCFQCNEDYAGYEDKTDWFIGILIPCHIIIPQNPAPSSRGANETLRDGELTP